MKKAIISSAILLFFFAAFAQKNNLNVDYMLRGYIYASSSIVDSKAPGGFGGSENSARQIDTASKNFPEKGFFLKIDTTRTAIFANKFNGYKFYIVNKCDTIVGLNASDSRLNIIAEVFVDNKWQPIEYLPSSWCGNSYHTVYLKQNQYWEFSIPKYTGKIKVKLRYKLLLGNERFLYSNEISCSINKKQLTEKQGHAPQGIMDPYND